MDKQKEEEFYSLMLNSLSGLEDDLGANQAPRQAIELMRMIIEICSDDYKARFSGLR